VVYTRCKYAADLALSTLPRVGIARIRMPIDFIPSPHNLIDKLVSYPEVVDVVNSVTIVEDMIQVFHQLLEKRAAGIFHVTNPGAIGHREILSLYKELVDSAQVNNWVAEEELLARGLTKKIRSNTILQSENLNKLGITMRPIKAALRDTMRKYAEQKIICQKLS